MKISLIGSILAGLLSELAIVRGEKITIFYDPGFFPALGTKIERRNGGVPQEGNLTKHLQLYSEVVNELVPDVNNNGLVIIDFESWRPIFRQNWGSLAPYKDVSYQIEKERHPLWPQKWREDEAERRFELSGREFVEQTIKLSRQLRPSAQWGYYAFPYCFQKGLEKECPGNVRAENDRIRWMFTNSDIILPSVYMYEKTMKAKERESMVIGRIKEAVRVSKTYSAKPKPIYVYIRYVYADSKKMLTEGDLLTVFQNAKKFGAAGIILWGSSFDLNSREKCESLQHYLESTMGPIAQSFNSKRISVDVMNNL